MAKLTEQISKSFQGLPPWAKGAIAIAAVGGTIYIAYKLFKSSGDWKKGQGAREEDRAWNQEFDTLNSNNSTKATKSKAELDAMANKIWAAMDGYGTDEDTILSTIKQLNRNADFAGLQAAYGIREISSGKLNPEPNFKGNLIAALSTELDEDWKKKINYVLELKKIKYRV